jgi:cold shock CspA family protein
MLRKARASIPWSRQNCFVCGAALLGALSFSRRTQLRGQILFFDVNKHFGIVVAESGGQVFLSGHELADSVDRNDWVEFETERNLVSGTTCDFVAKKARRIDCPSEYLLRGTVVKWFLDEGYGFIEYEHGGQTQSMFFHANDLLRIDGIEPVPVVGCKVSFFLGRKTNQPIAAQVWIEQWPEELTIEEQFAAAEELPIDVPEPIVSPQSVLAPETKNLSLIEIIRQRREGKQK